MGVRMDLRALASRHRDPGARRAAVALAALLEAARKFPGLPGIEAIAEGRASLEEVAVALARAGGPVLPGLALVEEESRPPRLRRGERRVPRARAARVGRGSARSASAALAAELATFDWDGVEDHAGRVLQEFRAAADRKRHGAFYTPRAVIAQLLDALPIPLDGARVLDPACGSGEFLIEAARRGAHVCGADVDGEAAAVAAFRVACGGGDAGGIVPGNLLHDPERIAGAFDAVIGNPPYVRFHNLAAAERAVLQARFETATGQFDLFAPFLELALARVRPGGAVAFVLPALVLRGARYAALRRFLLARAHVEAVIEHGDGVFEGVLAPTCVLVLRRHASAPDGAATCVIRWRTPSGGQVRVDGAAWRRDPHAAFAPVTAAAASLLARLESLPRLRSLAELGRGAEIGRSHPALSDRPGAAGAVPCLTGSDVEPWRARSRRWLDPRGLAKRLFPEERRARVLVRETGARLTAVAVEEGTAATRSLFHVVPHDPAELPLDHLLAWLHSSVAQWWFATCVRADSGIFPKLRIGQLGDLRIPTEPELVREIAALGSARRNARSEKESASLDRKIDDAFARALGLTDEERVMVETGAR